MKQLSLFRIPEHLSRLSEAGDPLEALSTIVDFEAFRPVLNQGLKYADGSRGGRPPYDPVLMFKVLILAAQNNVSDEKMEFLIRDRLSWMRFLELELGDPMPDANTIRLFRERLSQGKTLQRLFRHFDRALSRAGYAPRGGQIVDATLVSAPKQRLKDEEKHAIKEGKPASAIWPDQPHKAAQKDVDARWTVKFKKGQNGQQDIAIPSYGYKSHIVIDRRYRFIRSGQTTHAARHDGALLPEIISTNNTSSAVWADSAYRSKANEAFLQQQGLASHIHRKKPKGKSMPQHIARGNATRSRIRSCVEHVFAEQKHRMALSIRTIGIQRAKAKITLANMAYNMKRFVFLERRRAIG